ncbi:hypothetical protein [Neobacillus sp. FSL H8-0543]|uniref:hypothetical protein n=1 Tax=Neobacillus sp. FSL H8-0543 TaxID=2954672 RepID=UPI0031590ABB
MVIENFINLIIIFAVVYGLRYFSEPKIKNQGIKKLFIDIVISAILALIVQQLIKLLF